MLTKIIAHRGSKGTRPENTLPAFIAALEDGADGIETDVHLSQDGHLIIMHDEQVDRTTTGTGYIKDLTLAELKQLDAGVKYDPAYVGTRIPTLDEVVQLLIERQFTGIFNLEIKTNKIHYDGIEDLVADYFKHHSVPFTLVYSSFYGKSIERLHILQPEVESDSLFKAKVQTAKRLHAQHIVLGYHPDMRWVRFHWFLLPKVQLRPWTVNTARDMRFCYRHRFAGLITDYPGLACQIRQQVQGG
ncbi:glycerophosphodiester phosphodiesterase [Lactiplantibacillus pentosus]|uniref:Glycerophosphodiester phosphodiesterase n=3 Tax=Lactiplantibacillus pentosus TaxID=1589 RepID=A0AAX6LF34_LACPE|nr:glycerophosphodiester phosphodiesterase [Lactiplantibacillus pentosus]AYJ41790.1 glycerophosphodiester phosphodiesterase [Lactiplantibacillus pentosus]KRK26475.1 glycerophosphodiester phosphodiesterase [Lactiplantibacillus pentosus DSM 20314]MBU7497719.1 glycerophosphodiester phosphodiesterase [Lactiplantibacillus pentosus]MCC3162578.1 glycerophosphodiester phosphodiesterase [Lactiplantibacillus pentosus]MCJ8186575.1 glycerophosphodiester phosphodiesterase [Lactiplantibacillus pentosus]